MGKRAAHYTARVGKEICQHIALGMTLKQALDATGWLAPCQATFWRWIDEHDDFREHYERARKLQADIAADRLLELADEVIKMGGPNPAARYGVAANIYKWQAEVRNATKYGKKPEDAGKNRPLDPAKIRSEIDRLQKELGVAESKITPIRAVK